MSVGYRLVGAPFSLLKRSPSPLGNLFGSPPALATVVIVLNGAKRSEPENIFENRALGVQPVTDKSRLSHG
jgi:hypothetical protein